jgi:hypothetical protein
MQSKRKNVFLKISLTSSSLPPCPRSRLTLTGRIFLPLYTTVSSQYSALQQQTQNYNIELK